MADAHWDPHDGLRPPAEELDSSPPPAARRRTGLLTTVVVVAMALLAGIAVYLTRHPGGKSGRSPGPVPAGDSHHPAGSATNSAPRAGRRSGTTTGPAIARPITTNQIFPHAQVVADGLRFFRVIAVLNKNCAVTARGAFAAALTGTGCQRVARATFVDSGRQYAVTAGVAELPSAAAGSRVNRSRSFLRDIWFVGLGGPASAGASLIGKSVGYGYETVEGRYLIYALATYSNGRNPTGQPGEIATLRTLSRSFAAVLGPAVATPAG